MRQRAGEAGIRAGCLAEVSAYAGPDGSGISSCDSVTAPETATATTRATEEMMEGVDDPEFQIATEVLYHGSRQAFFAGAHRWMMFLAIGFGASAAVSIWGEHICGFLAALTAAADIAFDITGRSQIHADIRRRYYDMAAELAEDGLIANFGKRWIMISADEPPVFRWAEIIAYRNACIALGRDVPQMSPLLHRIFAHVWRG
jgi:hypothetical protein